MLHNDYTSLALHDKERNRLKIYALDFPTGSGLLREAMDFPLEGSLSGKAFTERRPLLIKDFSSPEFDSDVSQAPVAGRIALRHFAAPDFKPGPHCHHDAGQPER